jgi:hypothetical protein
LGIVCLVVASSRVSSATWAGKAVAVNNRIRNSVFILLCFYITLKIRDYTVFFLVMSFIDKVLHFIGKGELVLSLPKFFVIRHL